MKALLIVPKFFSYEEYIKLELEKLGYEVNMVFENVNEFSLKSKILLAFSKSRMDYFDKYFKSAIGDENYDIVLAIRASFLSKDVMEFIKEKSPTAHLFMYQWDSVKNNENARIIAKYFDSVSTFDCDDANIYGWKYRPLFYIDSNKRETNEKYDVAFICTLHSQRVRIYQKLNRLGGSTYLYMYSKFSHYIKERYLKKNREFEGVSFRDIKFKSLSLVQTNDVMGNSNIVVDYTHPAQTGFTMRTCEAIGHRCKLVTNNKHVMDADFYNENNVFVYDAENFQIPDSFICSPYIELPQSVFERYSITNWVKDIINYE